MMNEHIAKEKFGVLVAQQLDRIERMKKNAAPINFTECKPIIIGVAGGDGASVTKASKAVLQLLLSQAIADGKVEIRDIEGLTIERRVEEKTAVPPAVLKEILECHAILKGATTPPRAGDGLPNIECASVAMRRELELFANVRHVRVPEKNIDRIFFRENTEGAFACRGVHVTDDFAVDFIVATTPGCERIIRAAFEYAKANGKKSVAVVTKSSTTKTTDGKFSAVAKEISKNFPEIILNECRADEKNQFEVIVLPGVHGDVFIDDNDCSASIGSKYSVFEAARGTNANPAGILRAVVLLLSHIGFAKEADILANALDISNRDCTTDEFFTYVMDIANVFRNRDCASGKTS
jgi:isocitrate dehydrogenase (NAD+)